MLNIRRAEVSDIGKIAEIYNEAILTTTATFDLEPRTLEDRLNWFHRHDDRHPILVADLDGTVVGWACLKPWNPRAAYDDTAETSTYVKEEHRGKGVGRTLKQAIIDEAIRLGFHTLIAGVAQGSDASLHLNREFGFELVGTFKEVGKKFGRILDVTYFQKILNQPAATAAKSHDQGFAPLGKANHESRRYYLLDVFTNQQFGGNPLAVFPDAEDLESDVMQSIASELNLSETTFIQAARMKESDCTVRIFTPQAELPMAGHPTIGTAWAILKHQLLNPRRPNQLMFDEGVGPVRVDFALSGTNPSGLAMHQPLPQFEQTLQHDVVAELLSLKPGDIEEGLPVQVVSCGVPMIIVPLKSLEAARRASLRTGMLDTALTHTKCREVFLFTRETDDPNADVHCRMFAPRFGIPEDPATGGAHGPLGGYMFKYGLLPDDGQFVSEQGVEMKRPSKLHVHVTTDESKVTGVRVGGDCVEVGTGTFRLRRQNV